MKNICDNIKAAGKLSLQQNKNAFLNENVYEKSSAELQHINLRSSRKGERIVVNSRGMETFYILNKILLIY